MWYANTRAAFDHAVGSTQGITRFATSPVNLGELVSIKAQYVPSKAEEGPVKVDGVVRDVIPYGIAHGNRSILQGLNLIGLRRRNIPNKDILILSEAYKEIFKNENLTENLNNLSNEFKNNELVTEVVQFIEKDKKRPICTPFSK